MLSAVTYADQRVGLSNGIHRWAVTNELRIEKGSANPRAPRVWSGVSKIFNLNCLMRRLARVYTVDPASVVLNGATALTAALTLLFSRIDARRRRREELPDIQLALWQLSKKVFEWATMMSDTNRVMELWARGLLPDVQAELALTGQTNILMQIAYGDEASTMLRWRADVGYLGNEDASWTLQDILRLYGPEVMSLLEQAFEHRLALIHWLAAEFPDLRADDPEAITPILTQLYLTKRQLMGASTQLDEYIREHFPIVPRN